MPYYTFEDLLVARYQIPPKKPKPLPFLHGKEPTQEIMKAFNVVFSGDDLIFITDPEEAGIYVSTSGLGHSYSLNWWDKYEDALEFLEGKGYYFNQADLINQIDDPTYFDVSGLFIFVTDADPDWPIEITKYEIDEIGTEFEFDIELVASTSIRDTTQFPTINASLSFSFTDEGILTTTATNDFYTPHSRSTSIDLSQLIDYGQTLGLGTKEDFTLYAGFSIINEGPPPTIDFVPITYESGYSGSQDYDSTMHTGMATAVILRTFLQYPDYIINRS